MNNSRLRHFAPLRGHFALLVLVLAAMLPSWAWSVQPNLLVFTIEPSNGSAGQTLAPIAVSVEDRVGNVITSDNTTQIQLTLSSNTLNGTVVQTVVAGVATFSDLSINAVGTGYTLTAASTNVGPPPLVSAISTPFDISAGPPAKLAFVQQPTDTLAGGYVNPPVTVVVEDLGGNPVTTDNGTLVTISVMTPCGPIKLESETDSAGIATFPSLRLNTIATGVVLDASASGLAGASSTAFNVLANPDRVFFDGFDDPTCTP